MSATTESRVLDWLATRQDEMLAALEAMVNTDGGSYDKPGGDGVVSFAVTYTLDINFN